MGNTEDQGYLDLKVLQRQDTHTAHELSEDKWDQSPNEGQRMEAEKGWEGDRHVAEANYFPERSIPQTDTQTRGRMELWFGKAW